MLPIKFQTKDVSFLGELLRYCLFCHISVHFVMSVLLQMRLSAVVNPSSFSKLHATTAAPAHADMPRRSRASTWFQNSVTLDWCVSGPKAGLVGGDKDGGGINRVEEGLSDRELNDLSSSCPSVESESCLSTFLKKAFELSLIIIELSCRLRNFC